MHLISIAKLFTNLGGDEQDACYLLNIHFLGFPIEAEIFEYNLASVNPIGVGEHYESWKGDNALH